MSNAPKPPSRLKRPSKFPEDERNPELVAAVKAEQRRIGSLLRKLREERGLSQEQAAELAELTQEHLSRIETGTRGNVTLTTLVSLARAYKVSMRDLFPEK